MKKYFLVKSKIEGINEKGKAVKISEQTLVLAFDVNDAGNVFKSKTIGTGLEGCDIFSIAETKISEVFNN